MDSEVAARADQAGNTVFVVDDDPLILKGLHATLSLAGFQVAKYASAEAFLEDITGEHSGCVIADIRMPGISGIELQEELVRRNKRLAVIIMSGFADVPLAVRAMKAGALEILQKPFGHDQLVSHVKAALAISQERVTHALALDAASRRLGILTEREREILAFIVQGLTSKEIARNLNISPRTVEIHRTHIMTKFEVGNVAELMLATQAALGQMTR